MSRALVTGVTGFVGANVARALLARGDDVRVLARANSDRRNIPCGVDVVEGDLRDAERVATAALRRDEIFHVAADYRFWAADTRELYASNVDGTRNLVEAALRHGVRRFIHTSTVGTIGLARQPVPCDEETPFAGGQLTSHYKRSKLLAEQVVLEAVARGLPAVVVNPSTPIGPWDRKPTPTGQIIVDFMAGRLSAYVKTGLNFVHVKDVAQGHLLAAERGRIGQRYILGNTNLTMLDFLTLLARLTGRKPPSVQVPYALAWLAGAAATGLATFTHAPPRVPLEAVKMSRRFMFFDPSKARLELGLPQTPVETAAADALEWFGRHGFFAAAERGVAPAPQERTSRS